MAFELSDKTWKLGFTTGQGQKARERNVTARDQERIGTVSAEVLNAMFEALGKLTGRSV